jgi:hypothetical protein
MSILGRTWDSSAFNSLVIPEDKKHIIQSLVDSYADGSHSTQYDDIIRGKGQSLVILIARRATITGVHP